MAVNLPTSAKEIDARSKADVKRELVTANPFLKNSWLGAIITSTSNRIFDFYLQLKEAVRQSFPDTATGESLTRWAAIWGKEKAAATKANGNAVATGTAAKVLAAGTVIVGSDGVYTSTAAATISANSVSVSFITRSGTTATATTASAHGLANNVEITITGAGESQYNLTTAITVTGLDSFEYEVTGSPTTPATGTILAAGTWAAVPVESDEFGADYNLSAGEEVKLQSPLVGVDDSLVVDYGEIGGGIDEEKDDSLRSRTLSRIQDPVANFNVAAITDAAKDVNGVTRVFVQEVTPYVGAVTIYLMRDEDADPIPVASEVSKVNDNIQALRPATTDVGDVIVAAPTGVSVDFTFTALTPNTSTMREAIDANLRQFFDESTSVGQDIDEDAYRAAIYNTVDTVTGAVVSTFTLSAPSGDVTIAGGAIGTLGNITYAI